MLEFTLGTRNASIAVLAGWRAYLKSLSAPARFGVEIWRDRDYDVGIQLATELEAPGLDCGWQVRLESSPRYPEDCSFSAKSRSLAGIFHANVKNHFAHDSRAFPFGVRIVCDDAVENR